MKLYKQAAAKQTEATLAKDAKKKTLEEEQCKGAEKSAMDMLKKSYLFPRTRRSQISG